MRFSSTRSVVLEPLGAAVPATRVLRLSSPPVNSLSLEVLQDLASSIAEAEHDPECRAVVLASGVNGVFSAGLDINEMHQPDPERLRRFWAALQDVWIRLSSSKVATVAAIEGHAPAGGCLLSVACDWRIMSTGDPAKGRPFTIGLNETRLGIVAPPWLIKAFQYAVGTRRADIMLQTGALVTAERAAEVGLIDEAVDHADVMVRAAEGVGNLLAVPDVARHRTKMITRGPMLERLLGDRKADTEDFAIFCESPPVQGSLSAYLDALKRKSKL